ncbi:MAG TPA: protein kinase, partial [Chthoniobacterales bacterium]
GGMGTVWLARRADEQFEKLVAIKLLKRGTDTDEVLRRFQAERRILARLDHPNIARLLDAGMADDHLPYFVMEFVEGERLTTFAHAQKLSLGERLTLFLKICAAVQFAHQNLIVHRDLKPGNILVASDGEPKLLDFGVAKLFAPGDDAWQMTIAGEERFTPGYASPEQVRGDTITTISDVYSLGAILYELLTGVPPHEFATTRRSATETARVICAQEPARASSIASEPEMRRHLRGDLDNILARALAKEPARRYRGAGQLADDIRRYLENKPVHARADTFSYRAGKFLRRNRKTAIAVALLICSLVGGAIATLHQARIANRERARAVQHATEVRKIANSFMIDFYNMIAELPGSLAARQLVTQKAVDYLDILAREESDDLALDSELALAYTKIGSVTFDVAKAIETQRKAAALNERLVRRAPANVAYLRQLADSYDQLSDLMKIAGDSRAAIDYARRSLDLARSTAGSNETAVAQCELNLAIALSDSGDFDSALQQSRSAVQQFRAFAAKRPDDKTARRNLELSLLQAADAERESGALEEALQDAQAAFAIARDFLTNEPVNSRAERDMWSAQFHLAECLAVGGDAAAARDHYASALDLIERLAAADPNDIGHRRWLAVTCSKLGDALAALGNTSEAVALQQRALAISNKLAAADANRAEVQRDLIDIHQALGRLCLTSGERADAELHFATASQIAQRLIERDPNNSRFPRQLEEIRRSGANANR